MLLHGGSTSQPCKYEQYAITGFQYIKPISNVPEPAASNGKTVINTFSVTATTDTQSKMAAHSLVQPSPVHP
jgi:hypothetical protein